MTCARVRADPEVRLHTGALPAEQRASADSVHDMLQQRLWGTPQEKGVIEVLQASVATPLLTHFALKCETACEYQERVADLLADAGAQCGLEGPIAVVLHEELRAELAWSSGADPSWAVTLLYADGTSWSKDVRVSAAEMASTFEAMMRFRAQHISNVLLEKRCGQCQRPIVCARVVCATCSAPKCARCLVSFLLRCKSLEAEVKVCVALLVRSECAVWAVWAVPGAARPRGSRSMLQP